MKYLMLKKHLWTNLTIKLFSLILAFGLWSFLSQSQVFRVIYTVPICFFGKSTLDTTQPDSVDITLEAKRSVFINFDKNSLAVHINNELLHEGKNIHVICKQDLFLPSDINMIDCNPRIIEVIQEPPKEA